jgi:hypothetical protein
MSKTRLTLAIFASLSLATSLQALTVPYTEDFAANNANWRTNVTPTFMTFVATGGPDGSSYVSAPFNFQNNGAGNTPVLHRANTDSNPALTASGGNFFGNWIAGGVNELRTYVRHNASEPLTYFLRVADPVGFPGFIVGGTELVQPNTWTEIDFSINPNNPNNLPEASFNSVFDSIGRVQLGVFVPAGLAGVNQSFAFDLDQVTVDIPEPTSIGLCLMSLACLITGRSRRSVHFG